jgi:hypothetical protein
MGAISPHHTAKELRDSADSTMKGDGLKHPLPGVLADASKMDQGAYQKNRGLADKIRNLVKTHKNDPLDPNKPRFILAWRMYANADHAHWRQDQQDHQCGCGCGCSGSADPGT